MWESNQAQGTASPTIKTNLVDDEDEVLVGGVLLEVSLQVGAASSGNVSRVQDLYDDVRAVQHLSPTRV